MANEACFIRQRSLLHLPSKPVAFLIQVSSVTFKGIFRPPNDPMCGLPQKAR